MDKLVKILVDLVQVGQFAGWRGAEMIAKKVESYVQAIRSAEWTEVEDGLPEDFDELDSYLMGIENGKPKICRGFMLKRFMQAGDTWFTHYQLITPPREI